MRKKCNDGECNVKHFTTFSWACPCVAPIGIQSLRFTVFASDFDFELEK